MKILYVAANQDLASPHGGTVHVLAVADQLAQRGHEVHLAVPAQPGATADFADRIHVHPLKQRHRFLLWRNRTEIDRILDSVHPDVLIERYYNFAGEGIFAAASKKIPTLLEVNTPLIEYQGSTKQRLDALLGGALRRRRNRIAGNSTLILSPLTEIIPEEFRAKVRLVEWGADTALFDPSNYPDKELVRLEKNFPPDEFVFVHFGSFRKWHASDQLLEAFREVRKTKGEHCKLLLIGAFPDPVNANEGIQAMGEVPHEEIPKWLKLSDVAVLPFSIPQHRYLELGFFWSPLKVFESMAMELPIITLRHPRLQEITGPAPEHFFYDGTTADLSHSMLAVMEDYESARATARIFRQRVMEKYSWQKHAATLEALLKEITNLK